VFVETSETRKSTAPRLVALARLHPRSFDVLIVVLAIAITFLQLYKTSSAVVLYQGF
jgi:hypothetical protein